MGKRKSTVDASLIDRAVDLRDVPEEKWSEFIARGYRASCYKTDASGNGVGILFGFDTNGRRETFILPHRSWVKYECHNQTSETDIYGNPVNTKYFKNSRDRSKWIKDTQDIKIMEALPPEQEILQKLFQANVLDSDFNSQQLRTFYIDIETEISDSFMSPKDAENRINMITLFDTETDKFYTWSLENGAEIAFSDEPLKNEPKNKFVLHKFSGNEIQMLDNFMSFWEQNYPDVVCGWNSQAYDIPYIVRRIQNVFNDGTPSRLSPVSTFSIRDINHENARENKEAEIEITIDGIFQADDLRLYRDKFGVKGSLDGGYSLDNVGEAEGLGHKLHYDGTLKDLYVNNYQKFYEYNVRDVDLLKRIEEKCKLIPLARRIAGNGLCNYEAIYTSISYLVGSLVAFAKTQTNQVFKSYMGEKKESKSFEGAYVFPPTPGVYRGGIATVDFNSLYPSSIRNLNLSPETYVGKVIPVGVPNPDDPIDLDSTTVTEFMLRRIDSDQPPKSISVNDLKDLVKEKCVFTRNNCLFLKHSVKQGVVSAWCRHFFNLRKSTKKEMQKLEMKLYNKEITDPAEVASTRANIENLNNIQQAIKIMINSVYGITGTAFSPIGNIDLAQSITRHGKFLNTSASDFVRKWMKNKFNIDDSYISTISGDTDSQFLNVSCIVDYFSKKFDLPPKLGDWSDDWKLKFWGFVEKFVEDVLNPYVQGLTVSKCYSEHPEVLRYSLEYIGDAGIYEQKKRYAVHKVISEGPELVDKIKYTGIELKRSNVPPAIKEFLKDIYEGTLLKNWDNADYQKYLSDAYDRFKNIDVNEMAFWKGWSSDKVASEGFLSAGKGTTIISRAAKYHNDMIEHLGLGKKYDSLKIGNKIRLVYVNPGNAYGIDVIGFADGNWPKEFDSIFAVDYKTMFDKLVLDPLKSFRGASRFEDFSPSEAVAEDIFAF